MTMTGGDAKLFFMRNVQGFGKKSDLKNFMSENCKSEENVKFLKENKNKKKQTNKQTRKQKLNLFCSVNAVVYH